MNKQIIKSILRQLFNRCRWLDWWPFSNFKEFEMAVDVKNLSKCLRRSFISVSPDGDSVAVVGINRPITAIDGESQKILFCVRTLEEDMRYDLQLCGE